jgi:hypothetical protein
MKVGMDCSIPTRSLNEFGIDAQTDGPASVSDGEVASHVDGHCLFEIDKYDRIVTPA